MNISKYLKDYFGLTLAAALLGASGYIGKSTEKPYIFIPKQEKSLNVNSDFLTHFNLGLKSFISSTLWVSTILESDHDHYKKKDLNSWMFLRFNTISIIDPNFYENYAFGGPYLSIIKDDLEGASIIYDKGLLHFPDDFNLLRDSGFHYYFEIGDYEKALRSYSELKAHPKTSIQMLTTLARLESREGNLDDAYFLLTLQHNKIKEKNTLIAKKINDFIYAIKAERDLKCLNNDNNNIRDKCDATDADGNYYVARRGVYRAIREWIPFRAKK
jgi:hypothetical protein